VRGPDPVHAQGAQHSADLLVGHGRIQEHRQDLVQQCQPVLGGLAPLGQRLAQLPPGVGLPCGDGLVEQLHHLIEDLDCALGHQGQQDRERRSDSRRASICAVDRRPTPARNRRRSAGNADRSSS
jgi:hypothetical protein